MRHLTHRANAHPAQIEKQERRRAQEASRRTIEGQKVHLSGRSMWRGYWYGKGAIAKWNRAEQVLTGMKWSYYTGRQMHVSQISLLETHHSICAIGLNGAEAEKKGGGNHSPGIPRHAEGSVRMNPDSVFRGEAAIAHEGRGETAGPHAHMHIARPDWAGTLNQTAISSSGGEHAAKAQQPPCSAPATSSPAIIGIVQDSNGIAPPSPMPPPSGAQAPSGMDAGAICEEPQSQPARMEYASAPGTLQAPCPISPPAANQAPIPIMAFSEALSSAMHIILRHAGIGRKGAEKTHSEGARGEARDCPATARPGTGAHPIPPSPHPHGAPESSTAAGGRMPQHVYGGIPKKRGAQLKVARADAIPPQ